MIENGFYFASCKNSERIAKQEEKRKKVTDAVYDICNKYGKAFDELKKEELTKAEYKKIMDFISLSKYPAGLYPNLF